MIETPRLILRRWKADDVLPFHAMGRDMEVMRYLGPPVDLAACEATVERMNAAADADGTCFWAVEERDDARFVGFCGIKDGPAGTPIAGMPEIGWRLARAAWGRGLAREAAQACLDDAWRRGTPRVAAITVPANERSWGLMIRLGMTRMADGDFDHPALAAGDPLSRHLTYTIDRPA